MSDDALARHIGSYVRHHRMQKDMTQDEMAERAGMSRSTLSLLERGAPVKLSSLIQVLRVLDHLHVLDVFTVRQTISPLALVKEQKKMRRRASSRHTDSPNESDW